METSNEPLCVICLEAFKQDRKALSLPCGHSYCKVCIDKMLAHQKLTCPECRKETNLKSVSDLSINISLMRLSTDSENTQQLNILTNNLKQLRLKINILVEQKTNQIELYASKIQNHNLTLKTFINQIESLKKQLIDCQNVKKIETNDLNKLDKYTNSIKETLNCFTLYIDRINECVKRIKNLSQISSVNTLLLDLEKIYQDLTTVDEFYLQQDQRLQIDTQPKISNEISSYLKYLERKYSPSLSDLKSKQDIKLNDIIDGLEWDMKLSKFRIGFVGNSGKAKSSLINRLRNLPDPKKDVQNLRDLKAENEYDIAAPTGTGETTRFPVKYSWKNRPSILLKDFPGFGLITSVEDYIEKYLQNDNCHMYIILYTERLTKSDLKLAKLIKTSLKKPVILVRSKIDIDYANIQDEDKDFFEKSDNYIMAELKRSLIYEINQQEFDSDFDDTFRREDLKVFLVCAKQGNEKKYEMKDLINEIFTSLPDELNSDENVNRSNVFLNLSKNEISNIKEKLKKRIVKLSALSAATDIVPIAGQIADLCILIGEVTRYRDYFCLKKEFINELGKKYKIPEEKVTDIIKIVAIDAKYMNIKNFVLTITGAVSIGLSVAQAVTSAVSIGINIATFGAGCFISALISGPISYFLCKDILEKALDQMEKDSIQIIELIHAEIKNKED